MKHFVHFRAALEVVGPATGRQYALAQHALETRSVPTMGDTVGLGAGRIQRGPAHAELGDMVDSSPLLGDPAALAAKLQEDGYLLLRGLLPREAVLAGRRRIIGELSDRGWAGLQQVQGNTATTAGSPVYL